MSRRRLPYRNRAPAAVKELIELVLGDSEGSPGVTMYLVGNPAPSTYIVKEDGGTEIHRVTIGSSQSCSCGGGCISDRDLPPALSSGTSIRRGGQTNARQSSTFVGGVDGGGGGGTRSSGEHGEGGLALAAGATVTAAALRRYGRGDAHDDPGAFISPLDSSSLAGPPVETASASGGAPSSNVDGEGHASSVENEGDIPSSTGGGSDGRNAAMASSGNNELCVHLIWVMLKVLRAPATHPSVWQLSLTDVEFDQLLAFREARQLAAKRKHRFLRRRTGATAAARRGLYGAPEDDSSEHSGVIGGDERTSGVVGEASSGNSDDDWEGPINATQQPLSDNPEDDSCPICLDPMLIVEGAPPVTFCRVSCGQNVHVKCMLEYAEHDAKTRSDASNYDGPKCLLCRSSWGRKSLPWLRRRWDRQRRSALGDTGLGGTGALNLRGGQRGSDCHTAARCAACHKRPIRGQRYCCVACGGSSRYELCEECFGRGRHTQHAFVVKDRVGDPWRPAPRFSASQRNGASFGPWRPVAPMVNEHGDVVLTPDALLALQHRDLSPNDYDLLLALDQQQQRHNSRSHRGGFGGYETNQRREAPASLGAYLVDTLPVATEAYEHAICAHCDRTLAHPPPEEAISAMGNDYGASVSTDSAHENRLRSRRPQQHRKYPCGHMVHSQCAAHAVSPATLFPPPPSTTELPAVGAVVPMVTSSSGRQRFVCPIPGCGLPTFPGIYRRPRPPSGMIAGGSVAADSSSLMSSSSAALSTAVHDASSSIANMAVTNSISGSGTNTLTQPLQRSCLSEANHTAAFGSTIAQDTTNHRSVRAAREALLATEAARLEANLAEKMQRIKQQQHMQQQKKLWRQSTNRGHGCGRVTEGGISSGGGSDISAGPNCTIDGTSIGGAGAYSGGGSAVHLAVGSSNAGSSTVPRGGVVRGGHLIPPSMMLRRNRSTAALPHRGNEDGDSAGDSSLEGASGISLLGISLSTSSSPLLCVESEAAEGADVKEDGDRLQPVVDNSSALSAPTRHERTSLPIPSSISRPGGAEKDSEGDDVIRVRTQERRARALAMMQARKNAQAVATETAREEGERRRAHRMAMESQGFSGDFMDRRDFMGGNIVGDAIDGADVLDEAQLQALRRNQRLMDAAARRRDNDTAERQRQQERRERRTANAAAAERRREEALQATRARRPGARSRAGEIGVGINRDVDTIAADGAEEEEEEEEEELPPPPSSSAVASVEPSMISIRRRVEHQAELTRRRNDQVVREVRAQTQMQLRAEVAQRRISQQGCAGEGGGSMEGLAGISLVGYR